LLQLTLLDLKPTQDRVFTKYVQCLKLLPKVISLDVEEDTFSNNVLQCSHFRK